MHSFQWRLEHSQQEFVQHYSQICLIDSTVTATASTLIIINCPPIYERSLGEDWCESWYLLEESHLDHSIRFIQDHVIALVQHSIALVQAIFQPARRGHHNLASLAQQEALCCDFLPTHDADGPVLCVDRQLPCFFLHATDLTIHTPERTVLGRHLERKADVPEYDQLVLECDDKNYTLQVRVYSSLALQCGGYCHFLT